MTDRRRPTSNDTTDPLDAMLVQARWPSASAEARARFAREFLDERARGSRRLMFARTTLAIAASVMIVFGLARWMKVDRPVDRRAPVPVTVAKHETRVPIGRPPTKLENAIITSQLKREAAAKRGEVAAPAARPRQVVQPPDSINRSEILDVSAIARELDDASAQPDRQRELFAKLLEDGSPAAMQVYLKWLANDPTRAMAIAALDDVRRQPIDRLIAALRDPLVDHRIAAAPALGHIDGPVLTSRLIKMAERDESRREAMIALACSRGEGARQYVERAAETGPMISLARSVRVQFDVQ